MPTASLAGHHVADDLVSILIPVYNRAHLIRESVASALAQTYARIEVVVIDNASNDTTWEVLQELAGQDTRLRIYRNEHNIGPVRNWIACVEQARGTYAKILWSDDLIDPEFVSATLPLLKDNVAFVYTGARIFSSTHSATYYMRGVTGTFPSSDFVGSALYGRNVPYSPGCAIFRTADLRAFLVADVPNRMGSDFSQLAIGNDLLILLMAAHRYPQVGFVNKALSSFRDHPGSISISAAPGKLALHYGMAKGYFAQSCRVDAAMSKRLDAALQVELWRYRGNIYGFRELQDFYPENYPASVNPFFIIVHLLKNVSHVMRRILSARSSRRTPEIEVA
jgi:glycosyltransferase involved in cell wall biosynthesis